MYYFVNTLGFLPFSAAKIHRPCTDIPLQTIKMIAKKHHALWVKISPTIYSHPGFNSESSVVAFPKPLIYNSIFNMLLLDKDPYIPTKTVWLDLKQNQARLLKNMHAKTRYNIRKYQKSNIKYITLSGDKITDNQIKNIYCLWKKNNQKNKLFTPRINELIHLIKSFEKNCFVVCAISSQSNSDNAHKLLSFCLILLSPNMAFYWHNAAGDKGRKLFTPTVCVWLAICHSKKLGKKIFDFEGIYDPRFHKSFKNWRGFTRFKKGFI